MSDAAEPCRALVLAGSRGPEDPVARHAGARHKAFVRVGGVPMLARVVAALRASGRIGPITVCLDEAALAGAADPALAELLEAGAVDTIAADSTPSRSVVRALRTLARPVPMLVTTADHPLLTAEMVDRFLAAAPADADLAVALVRASLLRQAYPDTARTYYRFAGGEGYNGCNLFLLRTQAAARVAAFWSEIERHRKRPWRLVAAAGPLTLVQLVLGRLSLDAALRRLSRRTGATVRAVELPFAEAAIDVDKPADLALAEAILRRR